MGNHLIQLMRESLCERLDLDLSPVCPQSSTGKPLLANRHRVLGPFRIRRSLLVGDSERIVRQPIREPWDWAGLPDLRRTARGPKRTN